MNALAEAVKTIHALQIDKNTALYDLRNTMKERDDFQRVVISVLTELDNIDNYAARLEKYGEEDKAEGLLEASARIRNTMQKVLDCPPEKEDE